MQKGMAVGSSVPVVTLHCQPPLFEAGSPSMNCHMKWCGSGNEVGLQLLGMKIKGITYQDANQSFIRSGAVVIAAILARDCASSLSGDSVCDAHSYAA